MLKRFYLPHSTLIVIGLISGICFALFEIPLIFAVIVFSSYKKNNKLLNQKLLTIFMSIIIGSFLYQQEASSFNGFVHQIDHKTFNVLGVVTDYTKLESNLFRHRLTIQTKLLCDIKETISAQKTIYIYTRKFPRVYINNLILMKDLFFKFPKNNNFQDFMIKNKIAASVFVNELEFEKIKSPQKSSSTTSYKNFIAHKIGNKMSLTCKTMFNSIFLGNKAWNKPKLDEIKNNFQVWGLIHYLARSGLHLVLIAAVWQTLCNLIQVPILISNLIILFFMFIFTLLSWTALPFMRALIMLTVYKVCNLLEVQINLLHILNLSCIVTLFFSPISLFFLDFQLSFALTYGLVLFSEITKIKTAST